MAVEYTNRTSAEMKDQPRNNCPGYDTKPSDVEAPSLSFRVCGVSFDCHYSQAHSDPEW